MTIEQDEKNRLMPRDIPLQEVIRRAAPLGKPDRDTDPPLQEGNSQMVLFEGTTIRKVFHDNQWYFAVVDVVAAVTDSPRPVHYWSDLKRHLSEDEGFIELSAKIVQLKMVATDGKLRMTDTATVETILRIIQAIPSKKAEPFKRWLARVGYERIQEIQDPEISVKRAIVNWQAQGRTNEWIEARLRSIVIRKELTDEWQERGITQGSHYSYLTSIIAHETFGLTPTEHSKYKGLKNQSLRDNMTDLELVFTMLGEKSTTAIAQATNAQGLQPNVRSAHSGGRIAGDARKGLENKLGRSVVSKSNFLKSQSRDEPQLLPMTGKK